MATERVKTATKRASTATRARRKPAVAAKRNTPRTATAKRSSQTKSRDNGAEGKVAGMRSEAVARATGRTWDQWFAVLDKAGARGMEHKDIARLLHDSHGVSPWWSQTVTVGYERVRLGRRKHETAGGFQVSVSKTIAVPLAQLYQAWDDPRQRRSWLKGAELTIRKATPNKSMRFTWAKGNTHVNVHFCAKGPQKSQVVVDHRKLPDEKAALQAKKMWSQHLSTLQDVLEQSA